MAAAANTNDVESNGGGVAHVLRYYGSGCISDEKNK